MAVDEFRNLCVIAGPCAPYRSGPEGDPFDVVCGRASAGDTCQCGNAAEARRWKVRPTLNATGEVLKQPRYTWRPEAFLQNEIQPGEVNVDRLVGVHAAGML